VNPTVLSLEQALTLPYTTQRFVQLGWRVIRVESPPDPQTRRGGDPNRYIGEDIGCDDLHSYFIAPNVGKEAITLNLQEERGRELLRGIIRRIPVDVFLCNTIPMRYERLGIDFTILKQANPKLIWCGISAFGASQPERAGYDPALQAEMGFMYLTGEPDRDPMLCGLPIIDLKAGDEAFAQVLLAMLERQSEGESFQGRRIDISMAQCAASWLITALPQLAFTDDEEKLYRRSGNEHRSFIPCNCYPTKDGFVYLAIGNDIQWRKLSQIAGFEHIAAPERITNQGRLKEKNAIYADIRRGLLNYTTAEFIRVAVAQNLAVAPVSSIKDVARMDFVHKNMVETKLTNGGIVSLFPVATTTPFLESMNLQLGCAPRLGADNMKVYQEIGLDTSEIERLKQDGII